MYINVREYLSFCTYDQVKCSMLIVPMVLAVLVYRHKFEATLASCAIDCTELLRQLNYSFSTPTASLVLPVDQSGA